MMINSWQAPEFLLVQYDRLSDAELKSLVEFWPTGRWEEFSPLLQYCRAAGVRLMACGTPPEVVVYS